MFTKNDLKPGMLIACRDGKYRVATVHAREGLIFTDGKSFINGTIYNEDLTARHSLLMLDIVKVYGNDCQPFDLLRCDTDGRSLVWENKSPWFTGKAVCIESPCEDWAKIGKVYDIEDGRLTWDDGYTSCNSELETETMRVYNMKGLFKFLALKE